MGASGADQSEVKGGGAFGDVEKKGGVGFVRARSRGPLRGDMERRMTRRADI